MDVDAGFNKVPHSSSTLINTEESAGSKKHASSWPVLIESFLMVWTNSIKGKSTSLVS